MLERGPCRDPEILCVQKCMCLTPQSLQWTDTGKKNTGAMCRKTLQNGGWEGEAHPEKPELFKWLPSASG